MGLFNRRHAEDDDSARDDDMQSRTPMHEQAPNSIGFETVLGADSALEGALSSEGNVRLDGDLSGTLDIKGNVLVGETANIYADVDARNISIAGTVRGNVTGNKVQLLRTGRIWGNITAMSLTTEEGAFIDGKVTMYTDAAASAPDDEMPQQPLPVEPDDAPLFDEGEYPLDDMDDEDE